MSQVVEKCKNFIMEIETLVKRCVWLRTVFYVLLVLSFFKPFRLGECFYSAYMVLKTVNYVSIAVMIVVLGVSVFVDRMKVAEHCVLSYVLLWALYGLSTYLMGNDWRSDMKSAARFTVLLVFVGFVIVKDRKPFLRAIMIVFGTYLVADLVTMIVCPQGIYPDAVWPNEQAYYITGHKNGVIMGGMLYTLAVMKYEWPKKKLQYVMMTVTAAMLLASQILAHSATGLLVAMILVFGMVLYVWNPKKLTVRTEWITLIMLAVTALLVYLGVRNVAFETIGALLHRDGTLNSRTWVWQRVMPHIAQRPILGYGHESAEVAQSRMFLTYAHNTIVGALYSTGIVGLIVYLIMLWVTSRNISRKRFSALGSFEMIAMAAYLTGCMTEDRLLATQLLLFLVILANDTYANRAPKIAWAASTGGHYDELMVMEPLMAKYDSIIVTEKTTYTSGKLSYRCYFLTQMMRKDKNQFFEMIGNSFRSLWILIKEDPDAVVTTGVLAVIPLCLLMKLNGKKLVYVESFCRVTTPTKTGLLLAKYADETFVQWEELKPYYPKAKYKGGLL